MGTAKNADERVVEMPPKEFLKRKMALAGVNATTLAKDLGVHVQTVYNVTTGGRSISPSLALKLSKRFIEPAETWLSDPIKVRASDMLEMALNAKRARRDGSARRDGPTLFDSPETKPAEGDRILVDRDIHALLDDAHALQIQPFDPSHVQPASYDLTVGIIIEKGFRELSEHDWVLVLNLEYGGALQPQERKHIEAALENKREKISYSTQTVELIQNQSVAILTRELVRFGARYLAEVGSTAANAMHGLLVNHGSQIDPGYAGPIFVTAMNIAADPFTLSGGQKVITLTIRQLANAPEKSYREDIEKRVLEITYRLDAALKAMMICRPLNHDEGYLAEGDPIEGAVHGASEDEALNRAITTILAQLSQSEDRADDEDSPAVKATMKVLYDTTIDRAEAQALLEYFLITDESARRRMMLLFTHTEDRQRLSFFLSKVAIDPGLAMTAMFNGEPFGLKNDSLE